MTDDIVEYLRLSRTRFNRHAEAAEEIERLRALSIELIASIAEMAEIGMLPKITVRMRDAGKALDEAVHGD